MNTTATATRRLSAGLLIAAAAASISLATMSTATAAPIGGGLDIDVPSISEPVTGSSFGAEIGAGAGASVFGGADTYADPSVFGGVETVSPVEDFGAPSMTRHDEVFGEGGVLNDAVNEVPTEDFTVPHEEVFADGGVVGNATENEVPEPERVALVDAGATGDGWADQADCDNFAENINMLNDVADASPDQSLQGLSRANELRADATELEDQALDAGCFIVD